ncbi:class I SAM-dependent methyltransferase [Hymenobacter bucti]|uniref:Class I SAM-dependent methyltransferase n=1 Tax=Hymenobacter bucti TaxID=1844114 RepID=A0ABW4R1S6_9BACT
MTRTELLNYFVDQRNLQRYLEIGVSNEQDNFAHIRCGYKIGVDPKPVTTFQGTSDAFFAQNKTPFDLIFIDGLHTEEQALRDMTNASQCLASGGLIVLHDCLPPTAWYQRELAEFEEGENWNGQVWKAALRFFQQTTYACVVLDTDWGCGLIDSTRSQILEAKSLPAKLDYDADFELLLSYKMSVAAYFRTQVAVFYHLACMGNWQQVFAEQMLQLQQNGFRQVKLTMLGDEADLLVVNSICSNLELLAEVLFRAPELTYFETPAMLAMEAHARQHEGYVLYLHSKGVSNPDDKIKVHWRRLMMKELVEQWERCALQLPQYDVIGVNWRDMGNISHFNGNFWYASTRYLRKLADFAPYYAHPCYRIWDVINDKRLGCEFWIGSSSHSPRILSLVCRNEDFCSEEYWRASKTVGQAG